MPDLLNRIFHAKLEELRKDISKRHVFGKVAAFMYIIESKKGLSHAHFLVILEEKYKLLTPEAYENLFVMNCQILINPSPPSTKGIKYCKFKYPKALLKKQPKKNIHI